MTKVINCEICYFEFWGWIGVVWWKIFSGIFFFLFYCHWWFDWISAGNQFIDSGLILIGKDKLGRCNSFTVHMRKHCFYFFFCVSSFIHSFTCLFAQFFSSFFENRISLPNSKFKAINRSPFFSFSDSVQSFDCNRKVKHDKLFRILFFFFLSFFICLYRTIWINIKAKIIFSIQFD